MPGRWQRYQLAPGQSAAVELALHERLPNPVGPGFTISMVVSPPDTGKPVGRGQYRVALGR